MSPHISSLIIATHHINTPFHGDDNGDNNDDGDDALVVDMGDNNDGQLMNKSKHFQKVIDIGHARRLTVSYPKTGSENPKDAELLLALNYEQFVTNFLSHS
jgi:hypothetical protein